MKTYGEIKTDLKRRIDIYEKSNPTNSTRKTKILFLNEITTVLDELEQNALTGQSNDGFVETTTKKSKHSRDNKGKQHQPAAKKSSSSDEHGSANMHAATSSNLILIGAMSLVCATIEESSSLLRDHLQAIIDEQTLSLSDLKKCYSLLNVFFNNTLFETNPNNLQRTMKAEHKLSNIPSEKLGRYIERSYMLEARIDPAADTDGLSPTSSSSIAASSTSIPVIIQQTFTSYENLLGQYNDLLKEELTKHRKAKIAALPASRVPQYNFLVYIIEALRQNTSKEDNEKMAILAGAMWLVRASISQEYTGLTFSVENKSRTHEILSSILQSGTTPPETVDFVLDKMYAFLIETRKSNPENTNTIPPDVQEILPSLLELTQQTIASNRISVLKDEMKRIRKEERAKESAEASVMDTIAHRLWSNLGLKAGERKSHKKEAARIDDGETLTNSLS